MKQYLYKCKMHGRESRRWFASEAEAWKWLKEKESWSDCDHVHTWYPTKKRLIADGYEVKKYEMVEAL